MPFLHAGGTFHASFTAIFSGGGDFRAKRPSKKRRTLGPQHRRRLAFEPLEDRSLLSVCIWTGGGGSNNNWNNSANWVNDQQPPAQVVPQPGDELQFVGTAPSNGTQNDFPTGTSFQSIDFAANGFVVAGNDITLTDGISGRFRRYRFDNFAERRPGRPADRQCGRHHAFDLRQSLRQQLPHEDRRRHAEPFRRQHLLRRHRDRRRNPKRGQRRRLGPVRQRPAGQWRQRRARPERPQRHRRRGWAYQWLDPKHRRRQHHRHELRRFQRGDRR